MPGLGRGLAENAIRRVFTRGRPSAHSMAAANSALSESTGVIELVSGCAEAQHPQAREVPPLHKTRASLQSAVRSPAVTLMPCKPDGIQHLRLESSIRAANQDDDDGPAG
jgi:hypothetical protein